MLGIGSGSFDPETLTVLETAFDEAWITLKTNGSGNIRPNELARRICHLAMEGERDPASLSLPQKGVEFLELPGTFQIAAIGHRGNSGNF